MRWSWDDTCFPWRASKKTREMTPEDELRVLLYDVRELVGRIGDLEARVAGIDNRVRELKLKVKP